jgi:hypothetical protein
MTDLIRVDRSLGVRLALWSWAIVAVLFLVLAVAKPASAAGTTTTTAPQVTAQSSDPNSKDNGWLAFAAILFGAGISAALVITVSKDRRESREKMLQALALGASGITQSDTPMSATTAGGGAPPGGDLNVTADRDSVQVGSTATLTAASGTQPLACAWDFQPPGVISPVGTGPNANMVVTGIKPGVVTATATWTNPATPPTPPFRTGTKQITVTSAKSSTINFSILGAGLGSSLLALLAISGAIALAFRGAFTAEVGTILGTALGAGAAGAVSATHSPTSNSNSPTNPPGAGQP